MKRKQKQKLSTVLGIGGCALTSLALLAFTLPKMSELNQLKEELRRIEPLAARGAMINDSKGTGQDSDAEKSRKAPLSLPTQEDSLEFGRMVAHCAEVISPKIEIDVYEVQKPMKWPPGIDKEAKELPNEYKEISQPSAGSDSMRRHQIKIEFRCQYLALLQFCKQLQTLPRLTEICSVEIAKGSEDSLEVAMTLEAYSLVWPQQP